MSYEIKKLVVQAIAKGKSIETIAEMLMITESEARAIINKIYFA